MNAHITENLRKAIPELQKNGLIQSEIIARGVGLLDEKKIRSAPNEHFRGGAKRQKIFKVSFETKKRIDQLHKEFEVSKTSIIELAFIAYAEASGIEKTVGKNVFLSFFAEQDLVDELRRRGVEL
ncbi:hypothetical protein VDG1235_4741 [Verrucomicrobiia bacterium DG1235]|nr:hypothetical protein VDG1235_4741 [Verrucomicrobiae bacterium DG1235]